MTQGAWKIVVKSIVGKNYRLKDHYDTFVDEVTSNHVITDDVTANDVTAGGVNANQVTPTGVFVNDNPEVIEPSVPPEITPAVAPETEPTKGKKTKQGSRKEVMDSIKNYGQMPVSPVKSNIHAIPIIGQIEGHMILPPNNKATKYEHIIPQLIGLEQNPEIEGVLIILNTVGGDVEAGLAIAEMLESMSKPTVSLVLGGGHSIGVPIACSCSYSYIVESATMTIHPIRLTGLVISVPQTYEYLDKMQDRVLKFISNHSKIKPEKLRELMFRTGELARDIGTVVVGKEAVDVGLINEVGGLGQAVAKLNQLIEEQRKSNPQKGGRLQ